MSIQTPKTVVSAYSTDEFLDIVAANEYGPAITTTEADRLIDLARRRTQARMGHSLDDGDKDFLVMTTWDKFCRDTFGSAESGTESVPNRFALCVPNFEVSAGRKAWLCEEAVSVDQFWLESGDGRRTEIEEIDQSDTQYHDDRGQFWAPKKHVTLIGFGDELLKPEPQVTDAM